MSSIREYWRDTARKRKKKGKCKSCGNMAETGTTRCRDCKNKRRKPK